MATSAKVTYSAVPMAGVFHYEVLLHNTSPAPYAIYAFVFGGQYLVPFGPIPPFPLQNTVLISSPPGWTGVVGNNGIHWGASDFQGSSIASGYIMPGQLGKFTFQSSTGAPPKHIPFGCVFHNNANEWGFPFDGSADLVDRGPFEPYHALINPLVLILGDEVFVRLNLPRPLEPASLREQVTQAIHSMTLEQRETAARALRALIVALTEVRAALEAVGGAATKQ